VNMTDAPFAAGVYAIINPAQENGIIATLSGAQTNPPGKKLLNNTVLKMYFVLEKQNFPDTAAVRLFWFSDPMLYSGVLAVGPFLEDDLEESMALFHACLAAHCVPNAWFGMIIYGGE